MNADTLIKAFSLEELWEEADSDPNGCFNMEAIEAMLAELDAFERGEDEDGGENIPG